MVFFSEQVNSLQVLFWAKSVDLEGFEAGVRRGGAEGAFYGTDSFFLIFKIRKETDMMAV